MTLQTSHILIPPVICIEPMLHAQEAAAETSDSTTSVKPATKSASAPMEPAIGGTGSVAAVAAATPLVLATTSEHPRGVSSSTACESQLECNPNFD
eukprot:3033321-Amphidinium_carterae.1